MALTASGFDGTIAEQSWAAMAPRLGDEWTFGEGGGDFRPSIGTTAMTTNVAPGYAHSHGVDVYSNANVAVTHPALASGSRWDAVCLYRDWRPTGGTVSLVVVPGTSAFALPAALKKQPGIEEHQPIGLSLVTAGTNGARVTQVEDLRRWGTKVISCGSTLAIPSPLNGQLANVAGVMKVYRSSTGRWDTVGAGIYYSRVATAASGIVDARPVFAQIAIPYPGYPYRVEASARVVGQSALNTRGDVYLHVDADYVGWTFIQSPVAQQQIIQSIIPGESSVKTGPSVVKLSGATFLNTMRAGWSINGTTLLRAKVVPA